MGPIRFGTDGWRARYDADFTEENVARVAGAVARTLARSNPRGTLYIGYDTRRDARAFAELAAGAAAGEGLSVVLSDSFCPIPALGWTVARDPASVGGLMLTASHNPEEYGGVKVRMADGGASPKDFTDAIELELASYAPPAPGGFETSDIMSAYLADLKGLVDVNAIDAARLKAVVDPLAGASRGYLVNALRDAGVEAAEITADMPAPAPSAPVQVDPAAPWAATCQNAVLATGSHVGFIVDADGDRLGAVDENGRLLTSHETIALVLESLVRSGKTGRVITTTSGSALVRRQAARLGCPLTVTPVGFKWVYGEMLRGDVLLGGEESGGIGIPAHMLERDGLYTALILCEIMAKTGKTLATLVADLERGIGPMRYARRDIKLDGASLQMFLNMLPGLNPQEVAGMQPVSVSHIDGLRLSFADDSWLLVRPSGTEPLIRVYAEAPTVEQRDALLAGGSAIAYAAV